MTLKDDLIAAKHPTGREADKFPLRLPDGMRDEIKATARAAGRTMNAEIVHRLRAYGNDNRLARIEAKLDLILGTEPAFPVPMPPMLSKACHARQERSK